MLGIVPHPLLPPSILLSSADLSAGLTALAAVNIEQSNEPLFPLLDAFALPEQQGLVMLQPLHVMKTLHFTLSGC